MMKYISPTVVASLTAVLFVASAAAQSAEAPSADARPAETPAPEGEAAAPVASPPVEGQPVEGQPTADQSLAGQALAEGPAGPQPAGEPSASLSLSASATVAPEESPAAATDAPVVSSAETGPIVVPYLQRYLPENNLWELGLFGGVMFPSSSHQLYDPALTSAAQQPFKSAGEIGLRFAYYPLAFLGAEVEAAAMPSSAKDGSAAGLWAARGHLIGQLPLSSVVPFLLVGGGALGAGSDAMGSDVDSAFHIGAGAKAPLGEHLLFRLDVRDTMSRKVGTDTSALAHSPEILFGITFVPSRRKPDRDGDGVLDYKDRCPNTHGAYAGCPAPDTDGDGILDDVDECVDVPGVAPSGCPDSDGDGLLDRDDLCPNHAGTGPGGCPEKVCPVKDTDGDGLTDEVDQCPTVPARTLDGCPAPEPPSENQEGDGPSDTGWTNQN